jgi:signal transduction histidine kinase
MGEMATGLAHEVNQPLTAIVNYTQVSINLLKNGNPDLIKLAEIAVKTQDQALRAGQIIHGVKRFCKATSQQRLATDINELINDSVNLCVESLKQNSIKLTLELTSNLPFILIDHIQIEQVILNLIRNSIDAILSTPDIRLRQIIIQSYLTPNNEIQVRVKDNGSGIEEDQQAQILMPFHTTKSDGMGMGLSISRSLIEAHNGTLHFNSQFGKGSTFYFTLPI